MPNAPGTASSSQERPRLLLPPLFEAVDAWRTDPSPRAIDELVDALRRVALALDVTVGRLRVSAPPLPDLDVDAGEGAHGAEMVLRGPGSRRPIGSVRLGGEVERATALSHALALAISAARSRSEAERATAQLNALDQAVRGISGVLDIDRVLQLITDRVRDLAQAEYAALGIVDERGAIERFITSGISDEQRARIGELPHGRGLLGLIIRENRTYRVADIATHPERYGFPPHHPEMHSFLGMPITSRGVPVGRLYLTNKLGAPEFSDIDQELVEMFALHAGIAIENARLHDQVRRLAVVDERDRISRDLHDSVIQSIYAQTLALDDVPELVEQDPEEARRRVDHAIDALHAVIRDIRNFIFGLRPVLLETGGFADGLEQLANELRRNGVDVSVKVSADEQTMAGVPIEVVVDLLAITREGLSNVARHAAASEASIELDVGDDRLQLAIADNGRGFAATTPGEGGHHGLANIRARVEARRGDLRVESKERRGTRIMITLPLRTAPAPKEGQ